MIAAREPECIFDGRGEPTAAQVVSRVHCAGGSGGRSSSENHSPRCDADAQRRPKRPRPAVCRSAKIDEPARRALPAALQGEIVGRVGLLEDDDLADERTWPSRAMRSSAMRRSGAAQQRKTEAGAVLDFKAGVAQFGEPRISMLLAAGRASCAARSARGQMHCAARSARSRSARRAGSRQQFEREIDGARRMGERADGDEIHAGRGDRADGLERHPAARFELHAPRAKRTASAICARHVVEQDDVHAREGEKAAHLFECVGFQFDAEPGFSSRKLRIAACKCRESVAAAR